MKGAEKTKKTQGKTAKPKKTKKAKKTLKQKAETKKVSAQKKRRKDIEESLMLQLVEKDKHSDFHVSLIKDYMFYYDLKESMQKDIEKRGLIVEVQTGNGFVKKVPNENIKEVRETTKIMLKILQDLKLQEPKPAGQILDDSELY